MISRRSLVLAGTSLAGMITQARAGSMLLMGAGQPNMVGGGGGGTTYYVSNTGSDSNNGTSPATPWQTIGKVNAGVYSANTSVLFNGGQTFSGALVLGTANYSGTPPTTAQPLIIGSYGTGNATISSGSSSGLVATNIGNITVQSLNFNGTGGTLVHGVQFVCSLSGATKLPGVTLSGLLVTNYGFYGIILDASSAPASAGYSSPVVTGCEVHHCSNVNTSGASSTGLATLGTGNTGNHTNVTFTGCLVHDCNGAAGDSSFNGSGIALFNVAGGLITQCIAHDNGVNCDAVSGGPVGIWCSGVSSVVIQYCESYNNKTAAADGGGFDIDGGSTNCTIQYCYSHGNYGPGVLVFAYSGGNNSGSIVRYNISQNDGQFGRGGIALQGGSLTSGAKIYGNTIYQGTTRTTNGCMYIDAVSSSTVANNIFFVSGASAGNLIVTPNFTNPTGVGIIGNCYFPTGGAAFSILWNSTTYTTMASWQTAYSKEIVSAANVWVQANPLLANPGNGPTTNGYNPTTLGQYYKLALNSPCIGVGMTNTQIGGVTQGPLDYFSASIPNAIGSGYNMGADGSTGQVPPCSNSLDFSQACNSANLTALRL